MSGLLAAHRLRQAGIDVVVFEKNDDVGGTWLENTYPGCRVDVPSHLFCYSFAQRVDWPQHFSTQPELLDYFRRFATDFGVRPLHPLLDHGRVDDVRRSFGDVEDLHHRSIGAIRARPTFEAVINATGQLNRPKLPDIRRPIIIRRTCVPLGAMGP